MANRSYLYLCDELPAAGKKIFPRGLSEYNYDVPLLHLIMMGGAPRVVRSAIWDADVGIVADLDGAAARALAFVDKLAEGKLSNRGEFEEHLETMRTLLASATGRYVLLEAGEIFEMQDGKLETQVKKLVTEIVKLQPKVDRAIAGRENAWLATLRTDWEKTGVSYWSSVLYFYFEKPKAKSPSKAKPKPAKRK